MCVCVCMCVVLSMCNVNKVSVWVHEVEGKENGSQKSRRSLHCMCTDNGGCGGRAGICNQTALQSVVHSTLRQSV